jgi:hypothetical protein
MHRCLNLRIRRLRRALAGCTVLLLATVGSARDTWWPQQALPSGVVRLPRESGPAPVRAEMRLLAQSIAGLAARSVNEGRGTELAWIESDHPSVERWGDRFFAAHPRVRQRGPVDPWIVIEELVRSGAVQGYILYRYDTSTEEPKQKYRPGMDVSVNIATSLASVLHGVIVGERLEAEAKRHGLKLLMDVRDKTQQWCFDTYRDRFCRDLLCTQDPRKPNGRDYAIAQGAFTVYGPDPVVAQAMKWLAPLSPILGWNGGDEFHTTLLATVNGQFQTCTDWVQNLPVLMAGAAAETPAQVPRFDPRRIDWSDRRSTVSFVSSDGDNVQWFETGFFDAPGYYWGNPHRGRIPFGWTAPLTHLAQLAPQIISYLAETATPNDELIEWHSGYFYPDLFALERPDRWELLAEQARRSWVMMRRNGTKIIGYNIRYLDRPDARRALEVMAAQTEGLTAILAFQYSPYNAGAGKVIWVRDKTGVEIPVITLRYQIWWHLNSRANTGTPMKIAREIGESAAQAARAGEPRHDWAMIHAWSYFRNAGGSIDENAENVPIRRDLAPDQTYESLGGVRGYDPALWSAQRLPADVRIVSVSEMAWRVRMQHDPLVTKKLLGQAR